MKLLIAGIFVLIISATMTMLGKGGGNFYIVMFDLLGFPIYQAAANSQFILFVASLSALILFHKKRKIIWKLALLIGICSSISAFIGGYISYMYKDTVIKMFVVFLLILSGFIMLISFKKKKLNNINKFIYWQLRIDDSIYVVNIIMTIAFSFIIGFASGIAGMAGGTFFVPLMILVCGLDIHLAVSTASVLMVSTSFMGFTGHFINGDFNSLWIIELTILAIIGGFIGGHFSLKTKPKLLKFIFALTNWIAALILIIVHFY